jgi:hypothetical protein
MRVQKVKRSARLQIVVTPSLRDRVEVEANRLGVSISAYLELVVGQHLATKGSQNLVNEKVL